MSNTTLEVRIGSTDEDRRLREDLRAMEGGEDIEERHVLVLDDEKELHRLVSPANLELLRAIREHRPESMRATAALVERDFKDVHRNLTELAALNVIDLESDGRSKRPAVRFDEIDVELSLGSEGTDTAPA
jgi:predicted transcriptional regulator